MKLHSNLAAMTAMMVIGLTLVSAANDESIREAWLQEEGDRVAHVSTPETVLDAVGSWVIDGLTGFGSWVVHRWRVNGYVPPKTALEKNAEHVTFYPPANPPEAGAFYDGTTVGYGPGSADSLPAFPNCEGPGCGALQQYRPNGVRVCRVVNLASNGTGSFQACAAIVEADSNTANKPLDITVFDTAGSIQWSPTCASSACSLWRGWYVMGQSAPGPVSLHRWTFESRQGSEDVVIRSIAHRGRTGGSAYSFRMKGYRHVVDHVSVSHGGQRGVQSYAQGPDYGPFDDSTYFSRYHTWSKMFLAYKGSQYDRVAPKSEPSTMLMFNSQPRSAALISHIAWLNSAILGSRYCAGCAIGGFANYRIPNANADSLWIHGNLHYMQDAGGAGWSSAVDGAVIDYTYNEMRGGSGIGGGSDYWPFVMDSANLCTWIDNDTLPSLCADASMHYQKNHVPHITDGGYSGYADTAISQDSIWRGTYRMIGTDCPSGSPCTDTISPPLSRKRDTALPYSLPFGFDTVTVNKANMDIVLDSAGAGWQVDSTGMPWMNRDTVDRRAWAAIFDTAKYEMPGDINRDSFLVDFFPNYSLDVDPKCRDVDAGGAGDGMCDKWEETVADTSLQPGAIQLSGYSAIELMYAGGIVNIDTLFSDVIPVASTAFRGAEGYGRNALETCRDSVVNGSWDLKVWLIGADVQVTPEAALGIRTIVEDSTADDQFDIIILTEAAMHDLHYTGADLVFENNCVYMTGAAAQGEGVAIVYRGGPYGPRIKIGLTEDGNLENVLLRDFRVWGDSTPAPYNQVTIFRVDGGEDLYIDHLSFIGGGDGAEINGNSDTLDRLTVGATLFGAVGFVGSPEFSSTNFIIDAFDAGTDKPTNSISLVRDAFMSSAYRMPLWSARLTDPDSAWMSGPWENINTMAYDAGGNRMAGSYGAEEIDWIGAWLGHGTGKTWSNGLIQVRQCYNPASSPCADDGPNEYIYITPGMYASDLGYYEAKVLQYTDYDLFEVQPTGTSPLPDSMKNSTRQSGSNVTGIWPHENVPDSLWASTNPRILVGAARQLSCGGVFSANRDSTDQWIYDRYINNDVVNLSTTIRGWGNTVYKDTFPDGTACPDFDSDGLPDAFEKWVLSSSTDSTSLPADSLLASRLAIEHYLNGDSVYLAGQLGQAPDATFGSGRYAYYADTMWIMQITGGGADTDYTVVPDTDRIPRGHVGLPFLKNDSSKMLWLTYDSIQAITHEDSAAATDSSSTWGYSPADTVRTIPVPGG